MPRGTLLGRVPTIETPSALDATTRIVSHGSGADLLALEATTASPASAPQASTLPRDDGDPPERIGRFLILREVGRGAMGVVYAAYDEELDRKVALKLVELSDGADASNSRNLLLREAQALARLSHPNVVAVHQASAYQGSVFIAMEFVDGLDLQRWLQAERRTWRDIVATFLQAGAGLLAAHNVGLVHRDFKPHPRNLRAQHWRPADLK